MRTFGQILYGGRQAVGEKAIPVEKSDACRVAIEKCVGRWFGRTPNAAERSEMVRRADGDPRKIAAVFKATMEDSASYGLFAGSAPTIPPLPPSGPTSSSAAGLSSSGGFPPELPIGEFEVYPDVIGLRTADVIAPRGGSAADSANRAWAASGRGDVDAPASAVVLFDNSPTQSAGQVLALNCLQVARTLGVQDVAAVVAAIKGAVSSRRKG